MSHPPDRGALARLVLRWEEVDWGPGTVATLLVAVIACRNLLEVTIARNPVPTALAIFVHYPLAYLAPFLGLTLVLAAWSGVAPARIARLMSLAWLLTLIPPLADLLLHRAREVPTIGYLQADPSEIGWIVTHFLDPRVALAGTTAGIRIETLAAVLLGGLYAWLRGGRWWRALGAAVSVYFASLFFFLLPALVYGSFRLFHPQLALGDLLRGEGLLFRGRGADLADATATTWLIPLLGLLALCWRLLERRGERPRWLAGGRGPGALAAIAGLLGGTMLAGVHAVRLLRPPAAGSAPWAPWDLLGPALLALGLAGGAWLLLAPRTPAMMRMLLGVAAISAAAVAGTAPAMGLGMALLPLAALRVSPERFGGDWTRLPVILFLSTAGAFAAGYALALGPEALARLPGGLLLGAGATGAGAGVLLASRQKTRWLAAAFFAAALALTALALGEVRLLVVALPLGAVCGWLMALLAARGPAAAATGGLCGGLALLFLLHGGLGSEPLRERLSPSVNRVARLERIRGERHAAEGRWKEARTAFKQALEIDPRDVGALRGLGLGYIQFDHRLKRGTRFLERAAEAAPDSAAELANLAAAYLDGGRPADALAAADRALSRAPRSLAALFSRARALEALDRPEEALAAWERYIDLARSRPEERRDLEQARRARRRLERAARAGAVE